MIDLSHPLTNRTTVYPGDPKIRIAPALTIDDDGAAFTALHLSSHSGTHLDAPAHIISGGRTSGQLKLSELTGEALIIHLPEPKPGQCITWEDLETAVGPLPNRLPSIVVVNFQWERYFGTEKALDHPYLSGQAADELVARGMRVLGVDTLSPDPTSADAAPSLAVHRAVLGADGVVENLCNVDQLGGRARVGFFPLPVDLDGAPVRAVAWVD